jgi:hypothetical protein
MAVHAYKDIPAETRARLQRRMEKHQFDEVVEIRRDEIVGTNEFIELRDMHFGGNRLCRTVTRSKWKENAVERGLVYCEDEHCLIVPTVCNNVSRVTRIKRMTTPGSVGGGGLDPLAPMEPYGQVIPPPGGGFGLEPPPPIVPWEDEDFPLPPLGRGWDWGPPSIPPYEPPTFGGCCIRPWEPIPPIDPPIPAIPEPKTWMLMLAGLAALLAFRKK